MACEICKSNFQLLSVYNANGLSAWWCGLCGSLKVQDVVDGKIVEKITAPSLRNKVREFLKTFEESAGPAYSSDRERLDAAELLGITTIVGGQPPCSVAADAAEISGSKTITSRS